MLARLLRQRPETVTVKEGWQPLWYLVLEITRKYLKDTEGCDADEDEVLALLQTRNLAGEAGRALYAHLSTKLRGTAVRQIVQVAHMCRRPLWLMATACRLVSGTACAPLQSQQAEAFDRCRALGEHHIMPLRKGLGKPHRAIWSEEPVCHTCVAHCNIGQFASSPWCGWCRHLNN